MRRRNLLGGNGRKRRGSRGGGGTKIGTSSAEVATSAAALSSLIAKISTLGGGGGEVGGKGGKMEGRGGRDKICDYEPLRSAVKGGVSTLDLLGSFICGVLDSPSTTLTPPTPLTIEML